MMIRMRHYLYALLLLLTVSCGGSERGVNVNFIAHAGGAVGGVAAGGGECPCSREQQLGLPQPDEDGVLRVLSVPLAALRADGV